MVPSALTFASLVKVFKRERTSCEPGSLLNRTITIATCLICSCTTTLPFVHHTSGASIQRLRPHSSSVMHVRAGYLQSTCLVLELRRIVKHSVNCSHVSLKLSPQTTTHNRAHCLLPILGTGGCQAPCKGCQAAQRGPAACLSCAPGSSQQATTPAPPCSEAASHRV